MTVLCQWCGAPNPDDREECVRCHSNLMVFSGGGEEFSDEDEIVLEQQKLAFDEHLLERLSDNEEELKQVRSALAGLEERVGDLERGMSLLEAGVKALIDLLDRRRVVREAEVVAAWERAASSEMAREELLERLRERRDVIVSRARTAGEAAAETCARALRSAELSLLGGQPLRAAEILAQALRRAPRNPELAALLGELAFEREDLGGAEHFFRQVIRWDPQSVEAHVYLGAILADTGREEEATEELERAAALAPENFLPHFSLGALYAAQGNHAEARRHLHSALAREELPQALFLLGLVELDAGRVGTAARTLERAVELAPSFEDAIYYLGLCYLERGWHRKALDSFRRVLELDPQRLRYQEAVHLVEGSDQGAPPLPPEAELLLREASEAAESGEIDRAIKQLTGALRIADHPSLLASLALLAASAGRQRQAVATAHQILRNGARGAVELAAWTAILEALRAARHYRFAQRWGSLLYDQNNGPVERGIAAYELALLELERGGDAGRALELAHSALELVPRELRQHPLAALGRIHLVREEYNDAVDYLEQAAELSASPAILTQLGLALLGSGEGDRAREVLQRARSSTVRDLKTDVLTHVARVGWLAGQGRRRG